MKFIPSPVLPLALLLVVAAFPGRAQQDDRNQAQRFSVGKGRDDRNMAQKFSVGRGRDDRNTAQRFSVGKGRDDRNLTERFSVANGLPDQTINCVAQDEDGFLWIGTFNGLSRFDGTEFVNFFHEQDRNSIPGNDIIGLRTLTGHRLLMATSSGLCLCDTRSMHCRNLLIPCSKEMFPFENFFEGGITLDDGGRFWTGSRTCVYQLDTNFRILRSLRGWDEAALNHHRFIYGQAFVPLGRGRMMLQVQKDAGYANLLFDGSGAVPMPVEKADAKLSDLPPLTMPPGDFSVDKTGDTWFVKLGSDSLYFFDHSTGNTAAMRIGAALHAFQFEKPSILEVDDSTVFLNLTAGGLMAIRRCARREGGVIIGPSMLLLPDQQVRTVFTDKDRVVWIGTINGLYRFIQKNTDREVTHFDVVHPETGKPEVNGDIFINDKGIFNCTDGGGIYYHSPGVPGWKNVLWKPLPESAEIWSIRCGGAGDTIWVATQQGLYWWRMAGNRHGLAHWPPSLKIIDSVPVTTQFTDDKGWIWMGLGKGHGLAVWKPATREYRYYQSGRGGGELPMRYPTAIAEDEENNLWLGGQDGSGLVKWTRDKDSFTLFTPQYNTPFDNSVIFSILADREGSIWIGTASGLLQFDIHTHRFLKFNSDNGLSSNIVYCLDYDRKRRLLYIGTKNGPDVLDRKTNRITSIRPQYGLPEEVVVSMCFDPAANKLYYNTEHEMYSLTPLPKDTERVILNMQITGVTISGSEAAVDRALRIEPTDNISIHFTAVNLVNGNRNNYFYRLNSNGDWIALGHQRQVNLSNLASGRYTFYVKAQSYEGRESVNLASLSFVVPIPFRRSPWFIVLLVAPILVFLYLLYKFRISQILHMQQVRNSIATDLHDDIGSSLTNINILAELSHSQIGNPGKASGFLERISEEVTLSSQSLDDIVWSINARNDSFEEIAARMRRYAAEVLDAANITSLLDMDERLEHKRLSMEQRRDLYLIFKEAINNICKHAGASSVRISLKVIRSNIVLGITDNGRGFEAGTHLHRNGLKNIRSRVEKWKGSCRWDSSGGQGTSLLVSLPMALHPNE